MKKMIAMLLAVFMLVGLTACGGNDEGAAGQTIGGNVTEATKGADSVEGTEGEIIPGGAVFAFRFADVDIIPGEPFDASKLPAADSVYQVPSCALEGTDNVYSYTTFEVTAFDEGNGEYVYSIYFLDPNLTTNEGLALGDAFSKAVELYGDSYEEVDGEYVYTLGNTQLRLIVENNAIASIEFRMVTNHG